MGYNDPNLSFPLRTDNSSIQSIGNGIGDKKPLSERSAHTSALNGHLQWVKTPPGAALDEQVKKIDPTSRQSILEGVAERSGAEGGVNIAKKKISLPDSRGNEGVRGAEQMATQGESTKAGEATEVGDDTFAVPVAELEDQGEGEQVAEAVGSEDVVAAKELHEKDTAANIRAIYEGDPSAAIPVGDSRYDPKKTISALTKSANLKGSESFASASTVDISANQAKQKELQNRIANDPRRVHFSWNPVSKKHKQVAHSEYTKLSSEELSNTISVIPGECAVGNEDVMCDIEIKKLLKNLGATTIYTMNKECYAAFNLAVIKNIQEQQQNKKAQHSTVVQQNGNILKSEPVQTKATKQKENIFKSRIFISFLQEAVLRVLTERDRLKEQQKRYNEEHKREQEEREDTARAEQIKSHEIARSIIKTENDKQQNQLEDATTDSTLSSQTKPEDKPKEGESIDHNSKPDAFAFAKDDSDESVKDLE